MQPSEYGRGKQDSTNMDLLRGLDQLQAREPLPHIEPPALVDQAVRNLARRELENRNASPIAGKLRWIAGLSTVSIALLAIGISMVQRPQIQAPQAQPSHLAPSTEPALKDELQQSRSAPEAARSAEVQPEARTSTRAKREISIDNSAAVVAEKFANDAPDDPARAWLDLARQLYDQGLVTESIEQLNALRVAYPDQELPDWALRLLAEQEQ